MTLTPEQDDLFQAFFRNGKHLPVTLYGSIVLAVALIATLLFGNEHIAYPLIAVAIPFLIYREVIMRRHRILIGQLREQVLV